MGFSISGSPTTTLMLLTWGLVLKWLSELISFWLNSWLGHSMWNYLTLPTWPPIISIVEILSDECIHQEMKTLKILSLYHMWFRNFDHLKYGPFSLDTEPLKFLAFWNCFYSVIFDRKHMKFGLTVHFHTIISNTVYLAATFIKQVCGGVLKLSQLPFSCFFFHFHRAISWEGKIQICLSSLW